jgi:hypothetical protein
LKTDVDNKSDLGGFSAFAYLEMTGQTHSLQCIYGVGQSLPLLSIYPEEAYGRDDEQNNGRQYREDGLLKQQGEVENMITTSWAKGIVGAGSHFGTRG